MPVNTDKVIQIAALDQDTLAVVGNYLTLPSPEGSLSEELSEEQNTIFGAGAFQSTLPTIASFSLSANTWLRRTAAYNATLKREGTSTEFTDEDMEQVGSSNTYKIVDANKNYWDFTDTVEVYDGGTLVDADDYTVNYLFGEVTFDAAPSGAVTVDGSYITLEEFGRANTVDISHSAETEDITDFINVKTSNGYTFNRPTLLTVGIDLSGFDTADEDFRAVLNAREEILVEVDYIGDGSVVSRGIFRVQSVEGSGSVGETEQTSVSLTMSVPDDVIPYGVRFSETSEAGEAFQLLLNSFMNREIIRIRYAPRGLGNDGKEGNVTLTDASVSIDVSSIVEMSLDMQNYGELEDYIA